MSFTSTRGPRDRRSQPSLQPLIFKTSIMSPCLSTQRAHSRCHLNLIGVVMKLSVKLTGTKWCWFALLMQLCICNLVMTHESLPLCCADFIQVSLVSWTPWVLWYEYNHNHPSNLSPSKPSLAYCTDVIYCEYRQTASLVLPPVDSVYQLWKGEKVHIHMQITVHAQCFSAENIVM